MTELLLAEWEVPPDAGAELSAPAEVVSGVEWRGQRIDAKVRVLTVGPKTWLFFQPQRENLSNYLVIEKGYYSRPIESPMEFTAKSQRIVRQAARNEYFDCARIFYLKPPNDEPLREAVMLWRSGDMVWFDVDFQNHLRFRPPAKASKMDEWSPLHLHTWLLKQWQNPASELRFSHQWLSWNEEKRRKLLYSGSGGLNELVQVMKWALGRDPRIQDGETWVWYLEMGSEDHLQCGEGLQRKVEIRSFSPQLWALREFFIAHFWPLPKLAIAKPPLCVQDFDRLHRSHIVARIEKRTEKQRLEAASQLRQWLRGQVSEAEAARLLPLE